MKCDFQNPCGRCLRQNTPCQFTREKPEDLYQEYRILEKNTSPEPPCSKERSQQTSEFSSVARSNSSVQQNLMSDTNLTDSTANELNLSHDVPQDLSNILSFWDPEQAASCLDSPILTNLWDLGYNPSFSGSCDSQLSHEVNCETLLFNAAALSMSNVIEPLGLDIYSDNELDTYQNKCIEIMGLIKLMPPMLRDDFQNYITPWNLRRSFRRFCEDRGYYSVLLHKQSLNTAWSSPILLLAIMIVGACHAQTTIPLDKIIQIALLALNSIESEAVSL